MKEFTTAEIQALRTLPPILDVDDLTRVLRISRSSCYKILNYLPAWKDEEEGWLLLRDDLISWIEKNTESS